MILLIATASYILGFITFSLVFAILSQQPGFILSVDNYLGDGVIFNISFGEKPIDLTECDEEDKEHLNKYMDEFYKGLGI